MFNYWVQHKYNPGTVPMEVNWEAIGTTARAVTQTRQQWQVKQATHWLPHNSNKKKWNMIDHNKCPVCAEQETGQHLH